MLEFPSDVFKDWIVVQLASMPGLVLTGPLEGQTPTATIVADFAADLVDNPAPQPPPIEVTTQPPPDWLGLLGELSDDSLGRLQALKLQDRLLDQIQFGTANIDYWMQLLLMAGPAGSTTRPVIRDAAEAAAIRAKLVPAAVTESQPDPAWSAKISRAKLQFHRDVKDSDIDYILGRGAWRALA